MSKAQLILMPPKSLPEDGLRLMWRLLDASGAVEQVFYGGQAWDEDSFVDYVRDQEAFCPVLWDGKFAGFMWLTDVQAKSANVHFASFSWKMPASARVKAGRHATAEILRMKNDKGEYIFDVLKGSTPVDNELACKYIYMVGAVPVGEIPYGEWSAVKGESVPAMVSYITRETTDDRWLEY